MQLQWNLGFCSVLLAASAMVACGSGGSGSSSGAGGSSVASSSSAASSSSSSSGDGGGAAGGMGGGGSGGAGGSAGQTVSSSSGDMGGAGGAGGVGGAGGAGGGGNAGPAGIVTGKIQLSVMISTSLMPGIAPDLVPGSVTVFVRDEFGVGLNGATVKFRPEGYGTITLPKDMQQGVYYSTMKTWAPVYYVDVTHALGSRKGIALPAPGFPTVTYNPTPALGSGTTIQWLPNNEAHVNNITVTCSNAADPNNKFSANPFDTGSVDVPASIFALPGTYSFGVTRRAEITENVGTPTEFIGWVRVGYSEGMNL